MTRVPTHLPTASDQLQPVAPVAQPSPLSGELDEIVEYMRYIGERRVQGRA